MKAFRLPGLKPLLKHLARNRELLAPRQVPDRHWLPLGAEASTPPEGRPAYSPKQFLFAERETLFRFDGKQFRETLPEPGPRVLFGVRSCDLTAIAYQDRFFRNDPYYRARRTATLLVGIDCTTPCDSGFCPTVDAGPYVRPATADLICHPEPDETWLLITCGDAGETALEGLGLPPASEEQLKQREGREAEVTTHFLDAAYITEGVRRLNAGEIPQRLWDQLGLRCSACSGCTSLCPTCSCFATLDRSDGNGGYLRERCWDSCLYEGFQREAGGHNPSGRPGERVARYWYHKFGAPFAARFGRYGCVGCGRCEQTCLGTIGVHTTMKSLCTS